MADPARKAGPVHLSGLVRMSSPVREVYMRLNLKKWIASNGNVKSTSNTSSETSEESTWGHLSSFQEAGVSKKNHFMSMDAIYDVGVSVLVLRLNKLNKG